MANSSAMRFFRCLCWSVVFVLALVVAGSDSPLLGQTIVGQTVAGQTAPVSGQVFRLDGGNSTYAFGVNERGELQPLYWGGRLGPHDHIAPAHSLPEMASFDPPSTTTPQEYASWGAGLYTEPALKVTFGDGNRDLVLHYVRASTRGSQAIEVLLKDISREIYVTLRYSMDAESGILARSASIENREAQPVVIEQAAAAQWTLPAARYTLSYLTGRWAGEWTLNQEPLLGGSRVLESRRGTTGHQANPWFAISRDAGQNPGWTSGRAQTSRRTCGRSTHPLALAPTAPGRCLFALTPECEVFASTRR